MKHLLIITAMLMTLTASAQTNKVYNEAIDPMQQIDSALVVAQQQKKNVICQLGGNWCPWCLLFADYITKNEKVAAVIADNYVYIHVNYPRRTQGASAEALKKRMHNAGRFGFPALVVLNADGDVIHIQDSGLLEEGKGYNESKVLSFLQNWTPAAM